jgi:hypothetical protein
MLSSGIKCYHLGCNVIIWSYNNVIIWNEMISSGANVIIWCYHVMLSSGMITPPFLFFLKTSLTLQILSITHPFLCFTAACNSAYIEHHVELLNCDHHLITINVHKARQEIIMAGSPILKTCPQGSFYKTMLIPRTVASNSTFNSHQGSFIKMLLWLIFKLTEKLHYILHSTNFIYKNKATLPKSTDHLAECRSIINVMGNIVFIMP